MNKALHSITRPLVEELPGSADAVPEWLHLVPAGTFAGADGRGPYVVEDAEALVAASQGRKLPVDENHSIDLVGTKGGASPARGWIVEMQARADGIWGRVEWTRSGKDLMEDRAYGFLSPVLMHTRTKPFVVKQVARVTLTNDPNLTGLTSLHAKEDSEMDEELRKALGLDDKADAAAIVEAVKALHAASTTHAALMAKLGEVAGVEKDAKPEELMTALQAKLTASEKGKGGEDVAELQKTITSLQSQLTQVVTNGAREKAETAIDAAIAKGKLVPALRDHMISRHMKDPAEVETELKAMPALNAGTLRNFKPSEEGKETLSHDDNAVLSQMGLDPKAFGETAKTLERSAL